MGNLSETIKSITNVEFPPTLHGKIMRRLAFLQFRVPFLIVTGLLTLNLIVSGWHIWSRINETEAFGAIQGMLVGFDWKWNSIADTIQTANDLVPVSLIITFAINCLLVGYIVYILQAYKKLPSKHFAL